LESIIYDNPKSKNSMPKHLRNITTRTAYRFRGRKMIATVTQIESVVTPSGNSGHVVVLKAWIGKGAIVTLKEKKTKSKGRR
jgi:putative transposon-encoded protein